MDGSTCEICGTALERVSNPKTGPATVHLSPWKPCRVCWERTDEALRQEAEAMERRVEVERIARFVSRSGVPSLARHLTLQQGGAIAEVRSGYNRPALPPNIPEIIKVQSHQSALLRRLRTLDFSLGDLLYVHGPVGVGKTALLWALALDTIRTKRVEARYISEPEMLEMMHRHIASKAGDSPLEALKSIPALILDEFGQHKVTEWSATLMLNLLNHRLNEGLGMVIASNMSPFQQGKDERPMIEAKYEAAVASRIQGLFEHIEIVGADLRQRNGGRNARG